MARPTANMTAMAPALRLTLWLLCDARTASGMGRPVIFSARNFAESNAQTWQINSQGSRQIYESSQEPYKDYPWDDGYFQADVWETIRKLPSLQTNDILGRRTYRDCALVGSSDSLQNRNHGKEINEHEVIIRINRVPIREFAADFGYRTDMLFGNSYEAGHGVVTFMGDNTTDCDDPDCYVTVDCSSSENIICARIVMVFKHNTHDTKGVWSTSYAQVGEQHGNISDAVHEFLPDFSPSSGFHALMTFIPLCEKMKLYGFAGDATTADGHPEEEMHDFEAEHDLLDRLEAGTVEYDEFPSPKEWWETHFKHTNLEIVRS